jgi:hypothetical protein
MIDPPAARVRVTFDTSILPTLSTRVVYCALRPSRRQLPIGSILTYDNTRACHILSLKQGPYAAETFTSTLTVCSNPMCPCTEVSFTCVPEGSSGGPMASGPSAPTLALDVVEETIGRRRELASRPQALQLAKAVVADLQPEDWRALHRYLVTVKL